MNPRSGLPNSRWRIQDGDDIFENQPICSKFVIRDFFGVADDESWVRFLKLKMVDPIWQKLINPVGGCGEVLMMNTFFSYYMTGLLELRRFPCAMCESSCLVGVQS